MEEKHSVLVSSLYSDDVVAFCNEFNKIYNAFGFHSFAGNYCMLQRFITYVKRFSTVVLACISRFVHDEISFSLPDDDSLAICNNNKITSYFRAPTRSGRAPTRSGGAGLIFLDLCNSHFRFVVISLQLCLGNRYGIRNYC
jgi:hypothetical protein